MANPTTNYGFVLPTSSDLVTDLPADFEVALQGVDTQMFTNANAAIAKTIVDAKGDIIAATAADSVSRLAVGANNTVLTADSTTPTGLKWAASAAGGKVLQVVQGETFTETTISSSTYTDSNITATITPTSATSKILVMVSGTIRTRRTSANSTLANRTRLLRGATVAQERLNTIQLEVDTQATEDAIGVQVPFTFMVQDSPTTTSATTYKIQGAIASASGTLTFQYDSTAATIILMEIGA